MKKLFITTSIPYVNADPHIGFALEATQADVRARFHRLMGDQVRYQSGTDENALKNVQAAEAAGMQTVDFINQKAENFYRLRDRLDLSWDEFIRTTEEKHKSGAQKLWLMTKSEDIYKKVYKGLYCVGCESFYEIEDLNESGECFEHPGKKLEVVEEENYFFRLSNYQTFIEDILNKNKVRIYPETRKNEVWGFVKRGLEDFSISRSRERAKNWGVEVPNDKSQVMYVWYDALANYITALDFVNEGELYRDFWVNNDNKVHVIGKGISRFHAIYWLAMLESAGIGLPSEIFIHGYVTSGGQKISKSIGNVIDPFEQIEKYGVDAVRYFLLKEIPSYGDGDYTDSRFIEVYNADLANGIGNLVSRLKKLCINFGISSFERPDFKEFIDNNKDKDPWLAEYCRNIADFRLDHLCDQISLKVNHIDKVLDDGKPWKFMKNGSGKEKVDAENCIKDAVGLLLNIALLLSPIIPQTSRQILDQFCNSVENVSQPLFPRISNVGQN